MDSRFDLAYSAAHALCLAALRHHGYRPSKRYAENTSLSLDSRFDLAYSAAHALCLAALRHHGYRPSKRYVVFQVLPDTLGLGPNVWRVLAKCHDMRNRTEYQGAVDVDERLVADLLTATRKVAEQVETSSAPRQAAYRQLRGRPNALSAPTHAPTGLSGATRAPTWPSAELDR